MELDYARQAEAGLIARRSADAYTTLANEVIDFARMRGATVLADVDDHVAERYVWSANAPGTRRPGQEPRPDTRARRRSGVRALFQTARALGIDDRLIGAAIVLPASTSAEAAHDPEDDASNGAPLRALTADEAERCRWGSRHRNKDTRLPAAVALALAGAGTGEMPGIVIGHVRLDDRLVWCPGAGRSHGRWMPLDDWAVAAIGRHIAFLARQVAANDLARTPLVHVGPQRSRRSAAGAQDRQNGAQSEMTGLLRRVLRHANLAGVLGLRPGSFAMHASVRAWERTGRVEAAAAVLGIADLNTAAAIVSYDWRTTFQLADPFAWPEGADG